MSGRLMAIVAVAGVSLGGVAAAAPVEIDRYTSAGDIPQAFTDSRAFGVQARSGTSGTSGTWELAVGANRTSESATEQFAWGGTLPFTLSFDGAGEIQWSVNGVPNPPLSYMSSATDIGSLLIGLEATGGNATRTRSLAISNLELDSVAFGAANFGSVSSPRSDELLFILMGNMPAGAWTLTGDVQVAWSGPGSPGANDIRFTIEGSPDLFVIPLPSAAGLAAAGLLVVPALRRRRA